MAQTNEGFDTNAIMATVISAIALLALIGWYVFPSW
jgi:hypothetical protein